MAMSFCPHIVIILSKERVAWIRRFWDRITLHWRQFHYLNDPESYNRSLNNRFSLNNSVRMISI